MNLFNLDAERSVIARLMNDNDARFLQSLRTEDFYDGRHRALYRHITALIDAGKRCDLPVMAERLGDDRALFAELGTIVLDYGAQRNIAGHAAIVEDHAKRRQLVAVCEEVIASGGDSAEMASTLGNALDRIASRTGGELVQIHALIHCALAEAQATADLRKAGQDFGVRTGLPSVDNAIGCFAQGSLAILAARPGCGKTAMLSQIAIYSARGGFPGAVFSLEMSAKQLGIRTTAFITGTNGTRITRGFQDEIDRANARLALHDTASLRLSIDTQTTDLDTIVARISEAKRRHGIQWCAVDHIGLVQGGKGHSRNDQIGDITWTLKRTAKKLNIAVIALCQLNRSSERDGRRPQLADLRDSGNIEQDADLVMFLHDPRDPAAIPARREIGLDKNRDGRNGWLTSADFRFDGKTQTFTEIAANYSENAA